ncbi:MAG: hypothetical protein IT392_03630 [Nitrospirae bacterium]|nr:hypothetical protein [Nitrospirota bacterium]
MKTKLWAGLFISHEVKSLINCNACHTRAAAGSYDELEIKIPGFGRWDD